MSEITEVRDALKDVSAHLTEYREKMDAFEATIGSVPGDIQDAEARVRKEAVELIKEHQEAEARERDVMSEAVMAKVDEIDTRLDKMKLAGNGEPVVDEHCQNFNRFIRHDKNTPEGRKFMADAETRALSEGTATEGGYLVPDPVRQEIIKKVTDIDPILQIARVIRLTKGNSVSLPKRTGIPTAAATGETGTPSASSSTYGFETRVVHPLSVLTYASPDFLADVEGAENFVIEDAAEAIQYQMGYNFILGNNANNPEGIVTNSSIGTVTGTDTTNYRVSGEDFYHLLTELNDKYRQNGTFLFNSTTLYHALTLRAGQVATGSGTANDSFLLPVSLRDGIPNTIAGKPFKICESIADDGTTAYKPVYFGDFNRGYYVTLRDGVELTRDPYSNKPRVDFLWRTRYDGFVANDEAIKILELA